MQVVKVEKWGYGQSAMILGYLMAGLVALAAVHLDWLRRGNREARFRCGSLRDSRSPGLVESETV